MTERDRESRDDVTYHEYDERNARSQREILRSMVYALQACGIPVNIREYEFNIEYEKKSTSKKAKMRSQYVRSVEWWDDDEAGRIPEKHHEVDIPEQLSKYFKDCAIELVNIQAGIQEMGQDEAHRLRLDSIEASGGVCDESLEAILANPYALGIYLVSPDVQGDPLEARDKLDEALNANGFEWIEKSMSRVAYWAYAGRWKAFEATAQAAAAANGITLKRLVHIIDPGIGLRLGYPEDLAPPGASVMKMTMSRRNWPVAELSNPHTSCQVEMAMLGSGDDNNNEADPTDPTDVMEPMRNAPPSFGVGQLVELRGLVNKPELNGLKGRVVQYALTREQRQSERIGVQVDGFSQPMAIKACNMTEIFE